MNAGLSRTDFPYPESLEPEVNALIIGDSSTVDRSDVESVPIVRALPFSEHYQYGRSVVTMSVSACTDASLSWTHRWWPAPR